MAKKKTQKQKYQRKNKSYSNKPLSVMQGQTLLISYHKGQVTITNEAGVPYNLGQQSMIRSYQGANKEHIVAKATNLDFVTDNVGSWPENFDYIFAIDTNTHPQKCNDFYCSASLIYFGETKIVSDYERMMLCRPYMAFDWYHTLAIKIETVAWMEVIKKLQDKISADKKVGIVIDSELGNLEAYNNHTLPIYGQWYLPDNYTFMYATADNKDEWCNKMIRQCDKSASQRLKEIVTDPKFKKAPPELVAPIGLISYWDERVAF